jgi:hypothetical protein
MKLIEYIKEGWAAKCYKWFSLQAMTIALAVQGGWAMLDADMRKAIPYSDEVTAGLTGVLLVFGIFGRLYKQDLPSDKAEK